MPDSALEGKLSHAAEKNAKATWETSRPPRGLKQGETNRLFVASGGFWRGCFTLADDVLYNLADEQAPFSFVFDTRTWTPISVVPVKRFRGMIGAIPIEVSAAAPV